MSRLSHALKAISFWAFRWIYSKMLTAICGGTPGKIPSTKDWILLESASSLAARIRSGKVTSAEAVRTHSERIREINDVLNCVVDERFEAALAEAKKADALVRSGTKTTEELERETPFLGVPFTVPRCLAVEGLWDGGSGPGGRGAKAEADAGAVALMREGGAIPLARTNVSEARFLRETHDPAFGRTRNPYAADRTAGGPFGGEGSLIASSGSPLGLAPSAALPSAFNGVFGHKPTAGACRHPACPMSRCSADLLPALRLLSKNSAAPPNLDEPVDVRKLRYYFVDHEDRGSAFATPATEDARRAFGKAVDHLRTFREASVERLDPKNLPQAFPFREAKINGASPEDATPDKSHGGVDLRKELLKALFGKSRHTLLFLLTSLADQKLGRRSDSDGKRDGERGARLFAFFQELLGSDGVLLCPALPTAAFRHNESLARGFDFGHVDAFEVLGLPATYCPAGLDSEGLPVGFQVVAAANLDRLTLAVAREFDRVLGGWKPPPTHGNFTLKNAVFRNAANEKVKTL